MFKIDWGKILVIPIFTLLLVINIYGFLEKSKVFFPVASLKVIELIHQSLVIGFYGLLVLLYVFRHRAKSTSTSLAVNTAALSATFLPFLIPLLNQKRLEDPSVLIAGDLIILFGMGLTIYALLTLGRNLSIIPQARNLIQNGPYRLIRHPLYAGELISVLGLILVHHNASQVAAFFLLIGLQTYRAFQEERLLSRMFAEYESYSLKTYRFLPGVF
ncbi:MAG: isoprenylcysteine carboxylmethyltransferase family protein [Deltaproteobacteria bacterium]|nr:isoprenylcysteine carboxylmethyltransferase family protein [Deltaproteobacteria bacterium]